VVRAYGAENGRDMARFRGSGAASRLHEPGRMKLALVLLALISLVALAMSVPRILPARASSNPKPEPVAASSCVDRYNALLKTAKATLIAGDRSATVDLLEEAKRLVPVCPALQDVGSSQAALLAMNACDSARVQGSTKSACVCGPSGARRET
jgi:hypothetical protein